MGLSIYQFANPITNENSTYLGILLLNNKLQAVMPYTSDFYTFTLLRQWKGGTSFQKKRARSKVLEAKSSIFHFWQKSDQGLCKQNMKVCILWVKVLWVHTLLFLISYFIFTSYFYRWKGGGGTLMTMNGYSKRLVWDFFTLCKERGALNWVSKGEIVFFLFLLTRSNSLFG